MKAAAIIVLKTGVVVVLATGVLVALSVTGRPNLRFQPLEIRVRIVSRASGAPVVDAVVGVAVSMKSAESDRFDEALRSAMRSPVGFELETKRNLAVSATKSTRDPVTTLRSVASVSVWSAWSVVLRQIARPPGVLVVDHPDFGRTVIPIDWDTPLDEGEEPDTWRLDLGTITIPAR